MARSADDPAAKDQKDHQQLRDELEQQVDEYLKKGGKIQEIEPNVMADPPQKPSNNYGSRPI